jgi:uncharacterized phage-like protein YoqJ
VIICGTGHRPSKIGGYGEAARALLVNVAGEWLHNNKPDKVITGMALGWDWALGAAAFNCEIPFIAAVPFEGQELKWPIQSQRDYHGLIKDASQVVYVCDPGYAAWKMQKRNEWMVDNSDAVLALWNGSDGGTANCVRYAAKQGKPIFNVWDEYAKYGA